jgi:dynein light intermediate chain
MPRLPTCGQHGFLPALLPALLPAPARCFPPGGEAPRPRGRERQRALPGRREWTEDGQLWVQYVSSTPATRLDVINLQEELDRKLQQRQARETGICPVREELYSQTFDELIRQVPHRRRPRRAARAACHRGTDAACACAAQVTINCAERGLLLLRVRDEIRMTVSAYQTLYESRCPPPPARPPPAPANGPGARAGG